MDAEIDAGLTIPAGEMRFATARSSGPGGQNVNKLETRVTLLFALEESQALSEEQKARIRERLGSRIGKGGELRVSSKRHRTQAANRRQAVERFAELLREALAEEPERRPTRVPRRIRRQRLENKRRRSEVKRLRREPPEG
jgi:ribosome-associated protein